MRLLNRAETRIAVFLSSNDFAQLISKLIQDRQGELATRYVEARAAMYLGGSTESRTRVYDSKTKYGYRRFDINCADRAYEVKFRGDVVSPWKVEKDTWFRDANSSTSHYPVDVWYLFIDGPDFHRIRKEDLRRLGGRIPYLHWTWNQFLELTS